MGQQKSEITDQQEANKGFVINVRRVSEMIDDLARQFPAFGPSAQKIKDELKNGMVKVVAQSQRPEESSSIPRVLG